MGIRFSSINELAACMNVSAAEVEKKITNSFGGKQKPTSIDVPVYSEFPPAFPQTILFLALVEKYGRFFNSGDAIYELKDIIPGRKFEADIALPNFKVVIEMDGWKDHGKSLAGFKRDREKWLLFATHGWLVIPISREQIVKDLENVIELIDKCVKQRQRFEALVSDKKGLVGAKFEGTL